MSTVADCEPITSSWVYSPECNPAPNPIINPGFADSTIENKNDT